MGLGRMGLHSSSNLGQRGECKVEEGDDNDDFDFSVGLLVTSMIGNGGEKLTTSAAFPSLPLYLLLLLSPDV